MHRPRPIPRRRFSEVFAEAATKAAARIRRDAEIFDEDAEVTALFARLEARLFDPALDVEAWRRSSAVSRQACDRFAAKLGPLKPYLDELRIQVAASLVRETGARISDIGRKVGFDVPRTFRRTFQRVMGASAKDLRQAEKAGTAAGAQETSDEVTTLDEDDFSPETAEAAASLWRRRVTLGIAERRQVDELRRWLRRSHPHLGRPRAIDGKPLAEPDSHPAATWWPVLIFPTGDKVGWRAASTVIERVLRMPRAEQRRALVHGLRFGESQVGDLLHNFALGRAVADPAWAVRAAEMAIELVEAHAELQGKDKEWWRAQAWASLGRVRLATGDAGGAEEALAFARAERAAVRAGQFPRIDVNLLLLEAGLRQHQRRLREAVAAAARAIHLCRGLQERDVLFVECHLERANLARIAGDPEEALLFLRELRREPKGEARGAFSKSRVRGVIALYEAKAHDAAEHDEEAEESFRAARGLCDATAALALAELDKAEARFRFRVRQFEPVPALLGAARHRYAKLGAKLRAAAATAELAAVELHQGRRKKARAAAAPALEALEALPLHRDARIASRLLRSLTEEEVVVSRRRLAELRRSLDLLAGEVPPHAFELGSEMPVESGATMDQGDAAIEKASGETASGEAG